MDSALRKRLYSLPEVKRILELIGLVSLNWNEIEVLWYLIYTCLVHELPRKKIDTIFKQFETAASQRNLIAALGDVIFLETPPFKRRISDLITKSEGLARERNHVVHGYYMVAMLSTCPRASRSLCTTFITWSASAGKVKRCDNPKIWSIPLYTRPPSFRYSPFTNVQWLSPRRPSLK